MYVTSFSKKKKKKSWVGYGLGLSSAQSREWFNNLGFGGGCGLKGIGP